MTTEKKESLVDIVLARMISNIHAGIYGNKLPPQDVLAKEFKVSRTVLREALSRMLLRNMLVIKPKIGTTINPPDQWLVLVPQNFSLPVVAEVRQVLESFIGSTRLSECEGELLDTYVRAEALLEILPKTKV